MGAKSSFYFDHDYNARNDQKILGLRAKFGWLGYGLYFAILENLCEANGFIKREDLAGFSLGLAIEEVKLVEIIDFCIKIDLFHEDERGFYSERILSHLEFREQLRESGRKGGRGNKKPPFSPPLAPLKPPQKQDRIGDDRIGDEIKGENAGKSEEEILKEIFEQYKDYFSGYSIKEHCGRLLNTTPETLEKLMAYFLLVNGKQMTVECKTKYAAEKYFINWAKKEANKQEVLNNYNRIFKPKPKQ